MIQRDLPTDHFRQQLSALDEALESIKTQMYKLIYEQSDIGFVRSSPTKKRKGTSPCCNRSAEGFVYVQLDRQKAMEDLIETEDGLRCWETERTHKKMGTR